MQACCYFVPFNVAILLPRRNDYRKLFYFTCMAIFRDILEIFYVSRSVIDKD